MSEPLSGNEPKRSLFERLSALLLRAPEDREQLLSLLRASHDRELLDADALSMIEGVLQVSELAAGDVMVPRSQMDVIDVSDPPASFLPRVIETGHSRFPVIEHERDNVIGVLHAKDLLRLYGSDPPALRTLLRAPFFIPESKRLNILLRDFRASRNHIAVVVDEFGSVSGMITIEDVLEQIVGDIEDEFDLHEASDDIVAAEPGAHGPRWRVRGITEITQFNKVFGAHVPDDRFDTIGGLVTDALGRVPHRGESVVLDGIRLEVLRADARQVHLLTAERLPDPGTADESGRPAA
ncbi:MAG TPA: transporter associated domain-containing protein [Quisquiliibacterium sp.]|nr:transporter associated domain-containing protein [Quisquiliibacterium sp.]HQN11310.1 transporter associated domain-containing protein [Quisquiliibacterium sp.]HQP68074.1 transporter associated domain-containing protein [Quisquiliibacterium sp.]